MEKRRKNWNCVFCKFQSAPKMGTTPKKGSPPPKMRQNSKLKKNILKICHFFILRVRGGSAKILELCFINVFASPLKWATPIYWAAPLKWAAPSKMRQNSNFEKNKHFRVGWDAFKNLLLCVYFKLRSTPSLNWAALLKCGNIWNLGKTNLFFFI